MILYVNGDSHTAGAEATNSYNWAGDDPKYEHFDARPHPDNLAVSWGKLLADLLARPLVCDAQGGGSNDRIVRTTKHWLEHNSDQSVFMIIQWSTWEREEWQWEDGSWIQVNASGIDTVPAAWQQRYKQFVSSVNWTECNQRWHEKIWDFHGYLNNRNIPHVFFNGNSALDIQVNQRLNWGTSYIAPYDQSQTYDAILKSNGIKHRQPSRHHYGPDGHCFWAQHLLQYLKTNNLV